MIIHIIILSLIIRYDELQGPEVVIEETDINFGLIRFGQSASRTINISNDCRVPAKWHLFCESTDSGTLVTQIEITLNYLNSDLNLF